MQGIPREQIDEHIEQLKASSEQQAQQQLKVFFIMDKIADKFGIKTTDEEINGHIAQLAIQRKVRPERMKDEMQRDGSLDQFKLQVREQKCVDKLLETAKITEVEAKAIPAKTKPAKAEHPKHAAPHKAHAPAAKPKVVSKVEPKTAKKTEEPEKKHVAKTHKEEKSEKKTRPTRKKKT